MRGRMTRVRVPAILLAVLVSALVVGATPLPVAASGPTIYIGAGGAGGGGSCAGPDFGTNGGDATPVFASAYAEIVTSGSIFVCEGTYDFATNPETELGGRSITIKGAGRTTTHLSGGNVRRIFNMGDETPLGSSLTLRDLHITEGGGNAGEGAGAVYVENVALAISNVTFDNSGVTVDGSNGGILTVIDGSATIKRSAFLGGTAAGLGGAIYVDDSTLTVMGSEFSENNAAWGGAILATGSSVMVRSSRFESNVALGHDGAIGVYDGSLEVRSSTFDDNEATSEYGGAIHTMDSDVIIDSSRFRQNDAAANGGAVDLCADSSPYRVTVRNSLFSDNTAGGAGGGLGIFCVGFAEALVTGNRFLHNVAGTDGGGVWISAWETQLKKNRFDRNEATSHGGGAAIWKQGAWTPLKMQALRGNLYRTNSADCGGGIAIDDGDEDLALLLSRSSRFTDNTATDASTERVCITDF